MTSANSIPPVRDKAKVRLGFIGAGWWATTNHMPILARHPDVEFVGVTRRNPETLRKIADAFSFPFATTDYRELLALDLDGVVVSSPHSLHYEHAIAAIRRGIHVLCEKPMALDPREAWGLADEARTRGIHVLIPYGWNYKGFTAEAKRLLDSGAVGTIEYALCHMASPTKDLFGGGGGVPAQWKPTLAEPDTETWQVPEKGGGYAHGQITHSSALLFWLTGLRASQVSALMTAPGSRVDMYDSAAVRFEGGAIGTISGAATLPDNDRFQLDVRIFGSEGSLMLDVERERVEVRRHDGKHISVRVAAGQGDYDCDVPPVRFVELIQGRGSNNSTAEIGAMTVELIDAMHRSARLGGQSVNISPGRA